MNFLNIPVEVIEGNILPYLEWNDLLRFRRVCTRTKAIAAAYMRINPGLAPEIEINHHDKTFASFLKMNIRTTKIFLNNADGDEFYQKNLRDINKFLKKCALAVKHLRVSQISLYIFGKEWDFLEALANMESFEASCFGIGSAATQEDMIAAVKDRMRRANKDPRFVEPYVPKILRRIKSIKVGQKKNMTIGNITNRTAGFLENNKYLEHITLPFNPLLATSSSFTLPPGHDAKQTMSMAFMMVDYGMRAHGENVTLKTFDFVNYHDEEGADAAQMQFMASRVFLDLLTNCVKYDVKLKNVGPFWFQQRTSLPELSSPDLGIPVLSLVNLHPCVFPMNMPNLERVEIRSTWKSLAGNSWRNDRPYWPALKSIDITVDSVHTQCSEWNNGTRNSVFMLDVKQLFQFFFLDVDRANVTDLRLNFTKEAGLVTIPKTEDIVASCPNLKRLTIIKWPGTNKALVKLWNGLPGLEEVSLEYCKDLGNVAFVGEDVRSPVFFKLKKLKKLSLKGLNQMPKLTDTLFSLVIRHLNLTHLTLTSARPITSVTPTGIVSLLDGPFAKSIEKFPFKDWSLLNVPSEEFKKLEKKFRAYDML